MHFILCHKNTRKEQTLHRKPKPKNKSKLYDSAHTIITFTSMSLHNLMPAGLAALTRESRPLTFAFSSTTTSFLGFPRTITLSRSPALKQSIALLPTSSLNCVSFVSSYVSHHRRILSQCLAVYLSSNPVDRQQIKHIKIVLYFVRKQVSMGDVLSCMFPRSRSSSTFSPRISHHCFSTSFAPSSTYLMISLHLGGGAVTSSQLDLMDTDI